MDLTSILDHAQHVGPQVRLVLRSLWYEVKKRTRGGKSVLRYQDFAARGLTRGNSIWTTPQRGMIGCTSSWRADLASRLQRGGEIEASGKAQVEVRMNIVSRVRVDVGNQLRLVVV